MVFDAPKATPTKATPTKPYSFQGSLFAEAQARIEAQAQNRDTAVTQAKPADVAFTQAQFSMAPSLGPQSGATAFTQSQFAAVTPANAQSGVAPSMATDAASDTDEKRKRDANDVGVYKQQPPTASD
ncbi:hypothetical protein M434DRAFT_31805 [Hypoxylon sp. CO27-5]|nr:hypothetical protein M434DRAFT_31805 [Hypoxylon sp. CO27-5]